MKSKTLFALVSFTWLLFCPSCSCKKQSANPIDRLPPETQTGANTFGCLVNGEVFVPRGPSLSPILTCYYQYLNTDYSNSKGYFFQVHAIRKGSKDCELTAISIDTDSLTIEERKEIDLKLIIKGTAGGRYSYYPDCGLSVDYITTNSKFGKLYIKKFDQTKQIVSGTFWFNAVNANGDTVKVTDGRFDMLYTR